jgi:5-methylcytosine-specific restriction endonuclease McrA
MASRPSLDKAAWQQTRAAVRQRDGNACTVCGATERLSVHHIVPARQGGSDEMENLTTLCRLHHGLAERRPRAERWERTAERLRDDPRDQDDPERGIFWGPPSKPGGAPRRWSRHWFDWRPEELGQRNR